MDCYKINGKWVLYRSTKVDMVCFSPERFGVQMVFQALALCSVCSDEGLTLVT